MSNNRVSVEFKGKKKIVKYPQGVVREFTKKDLTDQRQHLMRHKEMIERQLAHIDEDIKNVNVRRRK